MSEARELSGGCSRCVFTEQLLLIERMHGGMPRTGRSAVQAGRDVDESLEPERPPCPWCGD
eukprot:4106202-Prymnesium_polylepis.1